MDKGKVVANEQQKQQEQEVKRSWSDRLMDWIKNNHEQQPSLSAELSAMTREAIKDVRATLMESYFGKPEHASEPGTPLTPTMQEVSADRGLVGYQAALDSYASRGSVHGRAQEQDRGIEH
jgi:hypothetical protein